MPTILASAIIGKAQILAQDTTAIRWTLPELLGWLNDGQREIAIIRTNAFTKIASIPLVAGTKQTLPADGLQFLEFIRNMGVGGATPGATARKVPRRLLDAQVPGWHSVAGTAVVQHYVFDLLAPKNFYVYPPSLGTTQVEVLYSCTPTDCATQASVISADDIYETPLLDYLLYRMYAKDSEFVGNAERSLLYRKQFDTAIGIKQMADTAVLPIDNPKG